MRAPKLGNSGRALWRSIVAGMPAGWELDERETATLTLAARQADDVAALERAIKRDGTMVCGSQGQRVLNPAIAEVRQGRQAISRLLGQLSLPNEEAAPETDASRRARQAARARWDRVAAQRERKRGAA